MLELFKKNILSYFSLRQFYEPGGYNEIWKVAYPLIMMSASHMVMQFTDRCFIAWNSTAEVAAAMPSGLIYFTLFCLFMVTINFTSALVAQYYGARDRVSCVRAAWNGFYLAIGAAVIIGYLLPYVGYWAIDRSGHAPELIVLEKEYFAMLIPCGAFVCMQCAFLAFFTGRGKTMFVAVVKIIACAMNIILDYTMIFGKFGFPALGLTGAGLATTLSEIIAFSVVAGGFLLTDQAAYATRKYRQFGWSFLKKLLLHGAPAGFQTFSEVAAFSVLIILVGNLGGVPLAAVSIALSINSLAFQPLMGFSEATAIVVGQYIGRDRRLVALRVAYRAWRMATVYMLVCSLIYFFLPGQLLGFFNPENSSQIDFAQVLKVGTFILWVCACWNLFDAAKYIFMGAMRGAGDTTVPLLITTLCAWLVNIPGVFLLVKFGFSVKMVWVYTALGIIVESVWMFIRFRSGAWKKFDLIGNRR